MIHNPNKLPNYETLRSQKELIEKKDWDCLIVLDACRWDALDGVLDREVPKVRTPAYCTPDWCDKVWGGGDYGNVSYLSANAFTGYVHEMEEYDVNMNDCVGDHIRLWENHSDRHLGQVLPESVTKKSKLYDAPVVLHFLQPHTPFIGNIKLTAKRTADLPDCIPNNENTASVYSLVKEGMVTPELVRAAYIENLKLVLRELRQLNHNFEKFVVTADHGECLGPERWDHGPPTDPRNRIVPWVETEDIMSCVLPR